MLREKRAQIRETLSRNIKVVLGKVSFKKNINDNNSNNNNNNNSKKDKMKIMTI